MTRKTTTSSTRPKPRKPPSGIPSPLIWTGIPAVPGLWYDADAVDRVLRVLRMLRHTKGRWAGTPLEPDPWQIEYVVKPIFGWKRPDGTRLIRTAWVEVPRKNGKSTISSGLGIVLTVADREPGAEVYAAAGDKPQARIVLGGAQGMSADSPTLQRRLIVYRDTLWVPKTRSKFEVLSSDAPRKHGLNVHGAIIDEVHVHKSRDLIDALETGTGSREQPLVIFITTADAEKPDSIYDEKRTYTEGVAAGVIHDPSFYGVVYAASPEDDPFDERTWAKANPGIDVTVSRDYLGQMANRAKAVPGFYNVFRRLHLGIRTKQGAVWLPLRAWDACAGLVSEPDLAGRTCYGGLDLAATQDIAALSWVFPAPGGILEALWRFWLPQARLADLDKRTAGQASVWARDGWLKICPGDAIDLQQVRATIDADARSFRIAGIAFDPWQGRYLAQELAEAGIETVEHRQSMAHMAGPTRELERLILERLLAQGGNPVARWMFQNAATKADGDGNLMLSRARSGDKIDGIVALVMAVGAATRARTVGDEAIAIVVRGEAT